MEHATNGLFYNGLTRAGAAVLIGILLTGRRSVPYYRLCRQVSSMAEHVLSTTNGRRIGLK